MARRTAAAPQLDLFATPPAQPGPSTVGPAPTTAALKTLAARLPAGLYLGTSSWTFPGWYGLVYDRATSTSELARHGLAAYVQHPLFRTVGLDRTFYAPLPVADFAAYAETVPETFRFLVKAHSWCTQRYLRDSQRSTPPGLQANEVFLQPDYAIEHVIQPCLEGLGRKAGPLLFQFSPLDVRALGGAQRFAERLYTFLEALPRGPLYAVELRNAGLLSPAYRDVLAALGVCHCFNVHPSMPALSEQTHLIAPETGPALVVRWMLHPRQGYDAAKSRYEPFDRLVDHDLDSRQHIAAMCLSATAAGRAAFVIANNKAEGSSPCTIQHLAETIAQSAHASGPATTT